MSVESHLDHLQSKGIPVSVLLSNETTLTWSTTNATSCSASGAWTGAKSTSGTETVTLSNPGNNTFTLCEMSR